MQDPKNPIPENPDETGKTMGGISGQVGDPNLIDWSLLEEAEALSVYVAQHGDVLGNEDSRRTA